jgi:hypothetical protein
MKSLERDDVYSLLVLHILADHGGDAADDRDEEVEGGLPTSCGCNPQSDDAPHPACALADARVRIA